jgi:Peptidase family C25/Propeptide_C25/Peptidase family C25, C terminal ig-like domain
MLLGLVKRAGIAIFLLALFSLTSGQAVKSHKYLFNSDLHGNNIVTTDNSIIINYSLPELYLEDITDNNGTFYRLAIPGHIPSSEPGKPELPVLSRMISVPAGSSYKIRITDVKTSRIKPSREKIEGMLFPAQEGETKDLQKQKPPFRIDKALYASRKFIESDTVHIEHIGKSRGVDLACIYINPVKYNPGLNKLEVITSMKIEIIFIPGEKGINALLPESPVFGETFSKGIINYNPENVIPGYTDKPLRMIILTDTAFRKHLEPLIKWKTQKGFKVQVLYKGAAFAGNTYTEIRNTLKNIYLSSSVDNPPPEFLLIVGNVSKIPYYGTGQITDLYYGEFDGNGDYVPEMFIGRLPVADTTQLKTVVNKIIQYEKFEFSESNKFYSNALVTAGYDGGYADYMNGQVNYARKNYLTYANKINEYHFTYPHVTNHKDSVRTLINRGISFLNYTGHGTTTGWLGLTINNAEVDTLKNKDMYPFVISNACQTSSFELSNSFGTKWVVSDKKGAIGYAGASSDTYWSEDFYWSVGMGTPSADPTYASTGLGAYDRLFHTHGESPSDWYTTMSQVVYAGNLAVSASTSPRKKYYWEVYNLVGDPSLIPIIGTPSKFNIPLPDTLPNNIKTWSFTADPFSYAAVSHRDTLWDASFVSPSGSVTLEMPGISNNSCLVVITGQNKIPLIKTIHFSNVSREFINLTRSDLNDSEGNGNGLADFGETIYLDLTAGNLGLKDAESLYARISSSSRWITINTDSVMIGKLARSSEIKLNKDLSFTVSDSIPDKAIITIDLILKDTLEEKLYRIDITAHAPKLDIINVKLDDSAGGNGDDIADQGETIDLVFQVRNEGSSSISGNFNIASTDTIVTLLEPSVKSGVLEYGETTNVHVPVKISGNANSGATINLSALLDCSPYIVNRRFSFRVGQIRESFESESFKVFPWLNISKVPWIITKTDSYDGVSAARSGAIGHNSSTTLSIKAYYPKADTLKFLQKVSSELNYDFLIFKLNDKEIYKKSGETAWEKKIIPVPAGYNKMEWIYKKDEALTAGSDCAMIDMIDFSANGSVKYVRRDLVLTRLLDPVQKDKMSKESVTVRVINAGPDTIRGFNLAYKINNEAPVKQYFQNVRIPFGDSTTVTFTTQANFSRYGVYNMIVYGYGNADDYPLNDTLKIKLENTTPDEPIMVFPNPFSSELRIIISADIAGTAHFLLYTSTGKKVFDSEKPVTKGVNEITMNGRKLVPSVYYLTVEFPGVTRTIPVVRSRE